MLTAGVIAAGLVTGGHHIAAVRADNAAGDTACLSCHQQQASYEATAHRLTSRLPSRDAILASFRPGENVLRTANPRLYYRMDSTATGFYETAVMGRAPDTSIISQRMDYVTGLRKGQSFLYWVGDRLYSVIFEVREDEEGEILHLVTLWRSTKEEIRLYEENS